MRPLTSRLPLTALALASLLVTACDRTQQETTVGKPETTSPATRAPSATPSTVIPPDDQVHAQYAGTESCKECHEKAYNAWKDSHHALAEREVDPQGLDKDAFSPKHILKHGNQESETFLDADGVAKVLTLGLDKQRHEYPVKRIIGHTPLRQFLIPAPGGRLQTCDVSYDPHRNELFDVFGNEERVAGDWGAWTGQGMNWNSMCASCHNTRLRKHYQPRDNSYHTTMVEMSVGCEACHGPMKEHVTWQKNPPQGYDPKTKSIPDPTIKRQSKDQMLDTCSACHARRGEITGDLVPGESFFDHFSLTVTDETDIYHPDGQVRDENYNTTSFLSSRMHHKGVRCGDCHEPHSNARLIPGNMLCLRCHTANQDPEVPLIPDPTAHSFHKDGSTGNDCTNCHMPKTTYMQRDPRHDHGFTIPDPLLTKEYGTPNACNRCHQDKDADWALEWTQKWYGDKMNRPTRTRAILIAKARRGETEGRDGLLHLLDTEPIAAWQASFCHLLELWVLDSAVQRALLKQLANPSPLVREAALRSLVQPSRQRSPDVRETIRPLLDDPIRSVRVAAAWALVEDLDLLSNAGRELVHMLDLNSDQPLGRMQLSQFAMLRGDPKTAIRQAQKAIEWDPNSPPFHHDLAILLSMQGDTRSAITALEEAARLDPQQAEYAYKLGLAWSETGNLRKGVTWFETALQLDASNARGWYNLGLAYNQLGEPEKSIQALLRAEQVGPNDPTIPYARATIHARLNQKEAAIEAATRALQIRRDYPEAIQLIQSLVR